MTPASPDPDPDPLIEATLVVPYMPESIMKTEMQKADNMYCALVKSRRVRVVEAGGDKLVNLLGRNDPWAASSVCDDPKCPTCCTRTWIKEEAKAAKAQGQKISPLLITRSGHQCRREGQNYTLQCIPCVNLGRKTLYRGESSRSARQRHKEHVQGVESGLVTSPLVNHAISEHGGRRPEVTFLLDKVECRPLYRIVRESVLIANMPAGPESMNRCMEWGAPRVPVITVQGGDPSTQKTGEHNPRKEWS